MNLVLENRHRQSTQPAHRRRRRRHSNPNMYNSMCSIKCRKHTKHKVTHWPSQQLHAARNAVEVVSGCQMGLGVELFYSTRVHGIDVKGGRRRKRVKIDILIYLMYFSNKKKLRLNYPSELFIPVRLEASLSLCKTTQTHTQ